MDSISITRPEVILASSQVVITSLFLQRGVCEHRGPKAEGVALLHSLLFDVFRTRAGRSLSCRRRASAGRISIRYSQKTHRTVATGAGAHRISGVSVESATHFL